MGTDGTAVVTLPSGTTIQITREFDAPRHLVFRAWTTPELVKRWWTGGRGEATLVEIDLRVGGSWRYVLTEQGEQYGFHGEYREVVPNERLVYTEVFEGAPDAEAVNTLTFTEHGNRTAVTIVVTHASQANRDAHLGYAMEEGMQDALDQLERLARSLM